MDITLADEMNGIEAAERIQQTQQTPIIFMTAHTDTATLARATGPLSGRGSAVALRRQQDLQKFARSLPPRRR